MVVLGLLILIAVTAVVVIMVLRGEDSVRIDLDSLGTYNTDAATVFLIGALTVFVGAFGAIILMAGLKRARRRRAEMRDLKDRARRADTVSDPQGSGGYDARRTDGYDARSPGGDTDDHFDSTPRER